MIFSVSEPIYDSNGKLTTTTSRNDVPTDSPTVDPGPTDADSSADASAVQPQEGQELRVLLVGDGAAMPQIREYLESGIGETRYIVDQVATLADGFGAIVSSEFDVSVVDHYVGVRTGFDLLNRISEDGIKAPIVFVAGAGDHGTGITAVAAGAACYIVEDGIDPSQLARCIVQAMEQQTALLQLNQAGVAIDGTSPSKAQILSHIAERLRTPAAEILDAARDSLMYALPAHTVESLASIEDQANGLLTLANDLVDLSMLEAGHLDFTAAEFSLRGLIANVKRHVNRLTPSSAVLVVDEVPPDVPDVLVGDPGRLRRIIARFIESVMGHSSAARTRLVVEEAERNTTTITLRFKVTAIGQRPEPVDRPDGLDSTLEQTAALGLPVVLETLSRMGGRVSVEGNGHETPGVQFTIRLEMHTEAVAVSPPEVERPTIDRPVLVVADAISNRRSMVKMLGDANIPYVVTATVDDWVATRQASIDKPETPVLALIDSTNDPFAEADRLPQQARDHIPVVVVAASGRRGDAARCRRHGVSGYLSKPMDPSDLIDVINSTIALAETGDRTTLVTRFWIRDGRPSLSVLVVDDSQTNRFLMTRMLEERGHSTTSASDGFEALEMLERANFDVVLMDVMMPGMDGLEATRIICERRGEPTDGPLVIGVSAFTDDTSRDRGRDAGMAAFLAKPIRPDDLYAAVEQRVQEETPAAS